MIDTVTVSFQTDSALQVAVGPQSGEFVRACTADAMSHGDQRQTELPSTGTSPFSRYFFEDFMLTYDCVIETIDVILACQRSFQIDYAFFKRRTFFKRFYPL